MPKKEKPKDHTADLLQCLKHLLRWHDQISEKDIEYAKSVIDKAERRNAADVKGKK